MQLTTYVPHSPRRAPLPRRRPPLATGMAPGSACLLVNERLHEATVGPELDLLLYMHAAAGPIGFVQISVLRSNVTQAGAPVASDVAACSRFHSLCRTRSVPAGAAGTPKGAVRLTTSVSARENEAIACECGRIGGGIGDIYVVGCTEGRVPVFGRVVASRSTKPARAATRLLANRELQLDPPELRRAQGCWRGIYHSNGLEWTRSFARWLGRVRSRLRKAPR